MSKLKKFLNKYGEAFLFCGVSVGIGAVVGCGVNKFMTAESVKLYDAGMKKGFHDGLNDGLHTANDKLVKMINDGSVTGFTINDKGIANLFLDLDGIKYTIE